ncbi:MAG: TonB-dependent receptor [Acidobacteriaceae bacterium]|nr:TonB-dependent receptor [Acidobacteriaceae bacterium]
MLQAQSGTSGSISGTITDKSGHVIQGASVAVSDAVSKVRTTVTGADGKFTVTGLKPGSYEVQISATGFAVQDQQAVAVLADRDTSVSLPMSLASVSQEVTVESEADNSLASRLSPVKSVLDAGSARTEITSQYIRNFTSPMTDFADIMQAAPGTVSYSANGVGNGQAKIWFRGFQDDDYTMTWDGIPFEDANDPSHHSWAYVPAPAISYVDFDRSPGTASDFGPSNFGGSIHMFSPKLGPDRWMRGSVTYGSFNTQQYLGEFNSGLFGGRNPKANFWFEGHHSSSDGYQTGNFQYRTAGTAKFNYKFSDKTNLSVIGTFVIVDSNTPNNDATRAQIAAYGDNYLLEKNQYNADGTLNNMWYRYYNYHVPTDFEVISYDHDFGHGWHLQSKPYTYSYSNHQHYQNTQTDELASDLKSNSGVNKLNQYNRGGNITSVSAASRYGVFRTGFWYEFTATNRYQIKSDPLTWVDASGLKNIKFHEHFNINTVHSYAEYQLVAIPRWTITVGIKDAHYTMDLKQYADGKVVGNLGGLPWVYHSASYNNWLPSFEANYRIRNNWSAYGQYGRGSIIPFSSVFDVANAQVGVTPPPTVASTYQGGTVLKLNRLSMDADIYHIHFDNQYSSYTPQSGDDAGITYYYATPPSNTTGFEAEGNVVLTHGLSLFLNGTVGHAKYEAADAKPASGTTPATPASPSAWVANAPHDTESIGLTYQDKGWDVGFFNKRIGSRWDDVGAYHQNIPYDPFWINNLFLNYTVLKGSWFDQSKIKLSINNIFDQHNIVSVSAYNAVSNSLQLYTPNPLDTLQLLPGRSVMITFQLALSRKKK